LSPSYHKRNNERKKTMRKSNIDKIEKALKHLGNGPFTISEVCETSKVSDPTVRNYIKASNSFKFTEVSYGKYQIVSDNLDNNLRQLTQLTQPTQEESYQPAVNNLMKPKTKSTTNQNAKPEAAVDSSPIQVHGELYLNAYLKGFDRGFELGLKKAAELPNTVTTISNQHKTNS